MKTKALAMAGLLILAGCNVASEADRLEEAVSEQLANQGTVEEVSFTAQDENSMTGHAMIRRDSGEPRRMNCTARRASGSNFDWNCVQAIDAPILQEMEGMIRERMAEQGEVIEVDMQRSGDDNNMAGHVVVRAPTGEEVRTPCRAVRDDPAESLFSWRCGAEAEAWARERAAGREGEGGK
jgi:hypothetical protein